jgi:hypothetical protein
LPVPTSRAGAFLAGLRGIEQLVELFRNALAPESWPEAAVCTFVGTVKNLAKEIDTEVSVCETFTATGNPAAALAIAVRALLPVLDAAVEKARTAISTQELLVDDDDRRFERNRRILEAMWRGS